MNIQVISIEHLRQRSEMFNMVLSYQPQLFDETTKMLMVERGALSEIQGHFDPFDIDIEGDFKRFIRDMSDPQMISDTIISTYNFEFVLVMMDFYACSEWYNEIAKFAATSSRAYGLMLERLTLMTLFDVYDVIEKFHQTVDSFKAVDYPPRPLLDLQRVRKPPVRSFAVIREAMGIP